MRLPHLRLFAILFAAMLLIVTVALPWVHRASARPTVGDFVPTLSEQEANDRVALAQQAQAAQLGVHGPAGANALPEVPTVYFPQTGHHLSNKTGFLDFWRSKGQMLLFGYPLTEEIEENG